MEEYTYNEDGYRIRTCLYNSKDPSSRFYTEEEVDGQGRPTASWDATGLHKTAYAYTARGAVREEIAPDGSRHAYGYLPDGRLGAVTGSTEDGEENSTTRAYTEDMVTELRSGRRTIGYTYDGRRRKTSVTVDGTILASFAYSGENTNAEKVTYATPGTDISRTTNLFGEVTQTTRGTSGNTVAYTYDTDHRLTSISNGGSDTITFTYDSEDRLTNAASKYCVEGRYYDNKGRMTGRSLQNGEFASVYSQSYQYTYDEDDNLTKILAESAFGCKPGKPDALGRYTGRTFAMGGVQLVEEESVAYIKHGDHATRLPSVIRYRNAGQGSTAYKYRYDARGNMTEVQQDGSLMCRYTYDTLGRLVREDNAPMGFTHLYTYDAQGNILRRRAYSVTFKPEAELLTDGYTDKVYIYDEHGDRLQSYDGESFVYDMVGNPTTYRGKAATWGDDRRLLSYNGTTFSYDARGNRTEKGSLQMYYDADGNLVYQSNGMYFYYDKTGLYALLNGGNVYFCRKDAMGNIVALLDSSGAVVVKYTYDAWGNCRVLNPDGTENTEPTFVGNRNPFRYRGYYFDTETGLYFLKTRYYDPAIGRFMTLDDFAYLDPNHVNGLNLYAYCNNNPVMGYDPDGTMDWDAFWKHAFGTLMIVGLIAIVATGIGALGVAVGSVLIGAGMGFATSVLGQGIGNLMSGKGFFEDFDVGSVIMSTFAGAAFATGLGGIWGAALIGAMANAGTAAFQKKSWAQIGLSAVVGGISGAIGYKLGELMRQKVYMEDDLGFSEFYQLARLDLNKVKAALLAVWQSWEKYLPIVTTGVSRGLSKYFGNKGVSFL